MASAWELDTRPTQPCVVCRGIPDRVVNLPRLPDVHVTFASTALCESCAQLAIANSVGGLTERALNRHDQDRPEVVPDLVRLVVTAFGHVPPPVVLAPEEFRHRTLEPLSDADAMVWQRLEPLVHDGPDVAVRVRGTIEYSTEDGERETVMAFRDGPKARLTDAVGQPWLLCDGESVWRRSDDAMYLTPYAGRDQFAGGAAGLAGRRTRQDVELFGFGTPIGPIESTTCLGRPAWRFRFAAPPHKPFDMAVVVDDATGLMLEERFGDYSVGRWTSFESDIELADELFVWTGPLLEHDVEQRRQEGLAEYERYQQAQQFWFAEHVAVEPITVRGDNINVMLNVHEDDGGFQASLSGSVDGSLARRPRSDQWWELGWSDVTHRWSDDSWDWALSEWDDRTPRLTSDELDQLKSALGSS